MKILLDTPSLQPVLNFPGYAAAFATLIRQSRPRFAIGIFGGWGSGKTTLMETIRRELSDPAIIHVEFSAWRYEKEEHLIVPLLDVIRQSVVEWADAKGNAASDVKKRAIKTASVIGRSMVSLLTGLNFKVGGPGGVDVSFDANKAISRAQEFGGDEREARTPRSFYHASFCALKEAFSEFTEDGKRRVVIFIDDLDRCLPEGALQVLESMKLFFDFDGFIFVVGLDKADVEAAIDARYNRQNGESAASSNRFRVSGADYIKKIFQVPFSLPPIPPTDVDQFVDALTVDPDQYTDLANIKGHLRFVATDVGMNPREIKRYINAFWIVRATTPKLDDHDVILALLTISFRLDWELVQNGLFAHGDTFLDALAENVNGNANLLSELDPRYENIPVRFFEYVATTGPANKLLTKKPIADYLYANTSAQSDPSGFGTGEILRAIGALRTEINALSIAGNDTTPVSSKIGQMIEGMKPKLAALASIRPMLKHKIENALSKLQVEISGTLKNSERGERQKWVDGWNAWITRINEELNRRV